MDVFATVGGRIVDHSFSLESLGTTSELHCFLLLPASWWVSWQRDWAVGRDQIASRSVAGECEPNAAGVVRLVMLT